MNAAMFSGNKIAKVHYGSTKLNYVDWLKSKCYVNVWKVDKSWYIAYISKKGFSVLELGANWLVLGFSFFFCSMPASIKISRKNQTLIKFNISTPGKHY